ncbi:MAG TPA: hypothetical protein DFS52_20905 [Myxococcales bacterium]|mgnify:CR=1 FL=1|jgi:hypothetical protein|nr:hypothetical protein [Myxococcales bacterium]
MAVLERRLVPTIQSLARIRAADKNDTDGSRVLWHQGSSGAEPLSYLVSDGRLERQDLTLFGKQIVWRRAARLQTGVASEGGGSQA